MYSVILDSSSVTFGMYPFDVTFISVHSVISCIVQVSILVSRHLRDTQYLTLKNHCVLPDDPRYSGHRHNFVWSI